MPRPATSFAPSFRPVSGSATVARERLRSAIHADRASVRASLGSAPAPRGDTLQQDLLDLLLAQLPTSRGGQP
jgi:hypothetical protein